MLRRIASASSWIATPYSATMEMSTAACRSPTSTEMPCWTLERGRRGCVHAVHDGAGGVATEAVDPGDLTGGDAGDLGDDDVGDGGLPVFGHQTGVTGRGDTGGVVGRAGCAGACRCGGVLGGVVGGGAVAHLRGPLHGVGRVQVLVSLPGPYRTGVAVPGRRGRCESHDCDSTAVAAPGQTRAGSGSGTASSRRPTSGLLAADTAADIAGDQRRKSQRG